MGEARWRRITAEEMLASSAGLQPPQRCGKLPGIPFFDGQADVVGDRLVILQALGRIELGHKGAYPIGMLFRRLFLNRLEDQQATADTVVVIDVLRSFTTAAVALARGASAVYPVEDPSTVRSICARLRRAISIGAGAGGAPLPGFDYGNSPSALADADLAGRKVVISTAGGVRGLHLFRRARRLYATSLVCARATAEAVREAGAEEVCFVITGEWRDRDGDEDVACADYIEALLRGESTAPYAFAQRVRRSDFGARFACGASPHLPSADLEVVAHADLFRFAMPVQHEGDELVIRQTTLSRRMP